ncbi:hypothetical protein EB796_020352 [Bugula neritina]|uniref:Uncharacterized protein n=1 Tax=Bugula neritina TaxID=10212 RepID=A0A7J7J5C0_BUGNE|nr:hypothetical protein EB796_020352 [Bugula neritina]
MLIVVVLVYYYSKSPSVIFHMVFHQHNDFCSYYVEEKECLYMCYFLQEEKYVLLPQKQLMALRPAKQM